LTAATHHHGAARADLDARCLASAALACLAGLFLLGGGASLAPVVPLAGCGLALLLLLEHRLADLPIRTAGLPSLPGAGRSGAGRPPTFPAPAAEPRSLPWLPVPVTPASTRAPLQRLAQAQGDHRFLLECRSNLSGRWLALIEEMEAAWARRDLGGLRWALYQLRLQSALWGVQPLAREARATERLLGHAGTVGFEPRCERALAGLRALLEGRR
jgi:hypothetical protein